MATSVPVCSDGCFSSDHTNSDLFAYQHSVAFTWDIEESDKTRRIVISPILCLPCNIRLINMVVSRGSLLILGMAFVLRDLVWDPLCSRQNHAIFGTIRPGLSQGVFYVDGQFSLKLPNDEEKWLCT